MVCEIPYLAREIIENDGIHEASENNTKQRSLLLKRFDIEIKCKTSSCHDLELGVFIDNVCFYKKSTIDHNISIPFEYDCTNIQKHELQLRLEGKRKLIDIKNETETYIEIEQITFNNLNVVNVLQGTYTHNFNGFGDDIVEEFSYVMGCDGTAELIFYTPISYWFSLEYPF